MESKWNFQIFLGSGSGGERLIVAGIPRDILSCCRRAWYSLLERVNWMDAFMSGWSGLFSTAFHHFEPGRVQLVTVTLWMSTEQSGDGVGSVVLPKIACGVVGIDHRLGMSMDSNGASEYSGLGTM